MSKFEKALLRLKNKPNDFTWKELQSIMAHFGYEEVKGSGSRRKFINNKTGAMINLHQPHPGLIIKKYALNYIIEHLREKRLL